VKGKIPSATADGAAEAPTEAAVKKKVKRLVEDKKDVLALVESVGGVYERMGMPACCLPACCRHEDMLARRVVSI
jgi:hypothetical protein